VPGASGYNVRLGTDIVEPAQKIRDTISSNEITPEDSEPGSQLLRRVVRPAAMLILMMRSPRLMPSASFRNTWGFRHVLMEGLSARGIDNQEMITVGEIHYGRWKAVSGLLLYLISPSNPS
jgi:hypothetical protein